MITRILSCDSQQPVPQNTMPSSFFRKGFTRSLLSGAFALTLFAIASASAQVNSTGQRPYLGWSTFSEQTINSGFLTQANVAAESDALACFRAADTRLPVHQYRLRLAGKL